MIASRAIQDNGDRKYNVSFVLLSHNEENNQKEGFRDLEQINGTQNQNLSEKLSKIGLFEKFWPWPTKATVIKVNGCGQSQWSGQSQGSTVADITMLLSLRLMPHWWHVLTSLGLTWQHISEWYVWHMIRVGKVTACLVHENMWRRVVACDSAWAHVFVRPKLQVVSGSVWEAGYNRFWLGMVGFYSGFSDLSIYAFELAVWWTEELALRVVETVGLTTVTRF